MDLSLCYHAVQIVLNNALSREEVSNTQNHRLSRTKG